MGKIWQKVKYESDDYYITEPKSFYKILLHDSISSLDIQVLNGDVVQITNDLKDHFNSNNSSIFIACLTTGHAL